MIVNSPEERLLSADFLILGGGIAGLDLALRLAGNGSVILLTKTEAGESNSQYAQGGIAAVLDPDDQLEAHIEDTLVAGAGLCHPETVRFVVGNGAKSIRRLIDIGVAFTRDEDGGYHLTREGGHSARRVIHTADATGKAVMATLLERVSQHPNIRMYQDQIAIDLITAHKIGRFVPGQPNRCFGAYVLDIPTSRVITYQARFTILATGGAGKVYLYTSNPDTATGDGIAMAYRAGCRVANMEFMQFHPTCLYHPSAKNFLISEAVRGEGGILLRQDGTRFMPHHHPDAELAPRDIVAQSIDYEMKRTGDDCVFLDISFKGRSFIEEHFPTIMAKCATFGIAIDKEPIPVVPAAHYTCGGVVTGLDGRTDLDGLFAIGEVSHTGLHGANRLASNSILECLVFADATANTILTQIRERPRVTQPTLPPWDSFGTDGQCGEEVLITHNWDEIRRFMGNYVGIVRSNRRLARARHRIELLQQEINEYYWDCQITQNLIELRNIALIASLIIRSAIHRKESRGLHYNTDYPNRDDMHCLRDTVLPILT
ncbi:L-aspartate oxidase [Candidatus Magnetaquicoccus inordinatus]|uniref:L-aspartate oxidase n=1 Tax=Candidatus Magnetaquicoccus inordinatus TaxID=2496818 RepID=UPI00102BBABF|nr:L-aspartate oxidase [Candidatus Magnetaquicoccus inordinatus]